MVNPIQMAKSLFGKQETPEINITAPPAPTSTTTPAKPIVGSRPAKKSMQPSFLASISMMPTGEGTGMGQTGKTLLGQ